MAEPERLAFVSTPALGAGLANPAHGSLTFVATSVRTDGALTALESTAAPGEGPPLHLHVREDELIYVVEGRLRVRLEDTIEEAPRGSLVFVPRGVRHTWQNAGDDFARFLAAFTPAAPGMERFFERAAALPAGTRSADAFGSLAEDAGMVVVGPPLPRGSARVLRVPAV